MTGLAGFALSLLHSLSQRRSSLALVATAQAMAGFAKTISTRRGLAAMAAAVGLDHPARFVSLKWQMLH